MPNNHYKVPASIYMSLLSSLYNPTPRTERDCHKKAPLLYFLLRCIEHHTGTTDAHMEYSLRLSLLSLSLVHAVVRFPLLPFILPSSFPFNLLLLY
jgi:hypothetical protein